jgi:putative DNA primase/helicase
MIAEHETVRSIQEEAECVAESGDRDEDGAEDGARDFVVEAKKDGTKTLYSDKIARWGRSSESAQKLGALSKRGCTISIGRYRPPRCRPDEDQRQQRHVGDPQAG